MSSPASRPRDSDHSRRALLEAAGALFAERGYDRTTTRDLGDRAGVDPALIARYFGSKEGLYLAALQAEVGDTPPADLLEPERLAELLGRARRRGPGPIVHAAVEDAPSAQAAREVLSTRLVEPLVARFADRPDGQLRAEVATAAFAGVVLGRGRRLPGARAGGRRGPRGGSARAARRTAGLISYPRR